jgi:seryl-tRNA synthetase
VSTLADAHRVFRDQLLSSGVLIDMGVEGLYGRSGTFERIVEGINHAFSAAGDPDQPEVMRFPPGIGKWQLEKSGYMKSFPQLAGTVHSFAGTERQHVGLLDTMAKGGDWTVEQKTTDVALAPAACYGVYPAIGARGRLGERGALVDVFTYVYRHEPSIDPARMQMFRQREHVRLGSPEQALEFRDLWMARARTFAEGVALPFKVEVANDAFFGRAGQFLANSQRDENLKFELLVDITSSEAPTACISFNYHRDLFGRSYGVETAAGAPAHSACVGYGVERLTLALLKHHGFEIAKWPRKVRDVLGL